MSMRAHFPDRPSSSLSVCIKVRLTCNFAAFRLWESEALIRSPLAFFVKELEKEK